MTDVINIKDAPEGWRDNPDYVYVGRPSKWGNPFRINKPHPTRDEVITRFKQYLTWQNELYDAIFDELKGKTLVCYCAPKACHADVLAKVADADLILLPV